MSEEYKAKISDIDLYKILDLDKSVCNDPDCDNIIRKAYIKKVQKYHPDKLLSNTKLSEKEINDIFDLITNAYDILKTKVKRDEYNNIKELHEKTSKTHFDLSRESKNYIENAPKLSKEEIEKKELEFMSSLNQKETAISKEEAQNKFNEILSSRKTKYDEYLPEKIFDGDSFNRNKFNLAFDKFKGNDNSLMKKSDVPLAWENNNSMYGSFGSSSSNMSYQDFYKEVKISKSDINDIEDIDYEKKINEFIKDPKTRLMEREKQTKEFEKYTSSDYSNVNPYSFRLGLLEDEKINSITDDNDIMRKYELLMKEREMM